MPGRRLPDPRDDRGFSLTEVMVSMSILSVVLVIVLSSVLQIYSAANRTRDNSYTRDQIANSFRRLDKELRYAEWVSTPGQVGTRYYLEYETVDGCRQLVYNGGVLTLAGWDGPPDTPGTPNTIATGLTLSGTTQPFTVWTIGSKPYASASPGTAGVGRTFSNEHPMIRVQFNANYGRVTLPFDAVYTALNVDRNTSPLNDCSAGRPTT